MSAPGWFFGTILVLIAGALPVFRHYLRRSLAPERVRETGSPADQGLHFEVVRIPTANGKTLFGWLIPAAGREPAPAVAVVHGWGGNAETMLLLGRPLFDAGFATLFFDARCHGNSDEDSFASLPRFAEDLDGAIDWLRHLPGIDPGRIAAVGHSVGAGAALLAASRRRDLMAVVSVAAFSHPAAMMRRWLEARGIPYLPVGWLILRYVEHVIGHRFDDIAPVATVGKVGCPTLLVHGERDETVPVAEARAIYAARGGDHVRLKIIAGSHDDFADNEDVGVELAELAAFLRAAAAPAQA